MQHDLQFSVRYITEDPVPIRDIIESLQGIDTAIKEAGQLLSLLVNGVTVQKVEIRVREIAQQSPLRELFLVSLFLAFQEDLEAEVPQLITDATGIIISDRMDTVVTVLALIVVFYGAGALKDLVFGRGHDGATKAQLDGLIAEVAPQLGTSEQQIRDVLAKRYGERTAWRKLANATARFFAPSKQQNSAPMVVNGRPINRETIQDVPADYLVDDANDEHTSRNFSNVSIALRAEDRDHTGRGWYGVVSGISENRLKMKIMDGVNPEDLWGLDSFVGDITVIFEKIGGDRIPREIHLHSIK